MIHVIIERQDIRAAHDLAQGVYLQLVALGRHAIIDTPWAFSTNMPERRLSAAEVLVTARISVNQPLLPSS